MILTVTSSVTRVPPESAVYVRVHVRTGPSQGPFSKLQLLLPYGFAPYGASAAPSSRLIVALNLEQGEGVLDQVTGMIFNLCLGNAWGRLACARAGKKVEGRMDEADHDDIYQCARLALGRTGQRGERCRAACG